MADESSLQFVPPPESFKEDRGGGFRGYVIFLVVLTILSIGLRLWSRSLLNPQTSRQRRFWWDDWVATASVPFILAQLVLSLVLLELGVGRHIWAVNPNNIETILKLLWIIYIVYIWAVAITKTSALLFLSRVFPRRASSTWFNVSLWVLQGMNICWALAYTFVIIFECDPVDRFWKPLLPGKCISQSRLYVGTSVPSVVIDFMILLLPMPSLLKLQSSTSRKAGIIAVFIFGYAVVVVSIGRMVAALNSQEGLNRDLTYEGMNSFYWGVVEAPITLFGVCFPAMLTLGRRVQANYLSPLASKLSSSFASRSAQRSRSGDFSHNVTGNDTQLSEDIFKSTSQKYGSAGRLSGDSAQAGSAHGIYKAPSQNDSFRGHAPENPSEQYARPQK